MAPKKAGASSSDSPAVELLHLVLQHGTLSQDQKTICGLLCSSKATSAAVAASCRGAVCLDLDTQSTTRFNRADEAAALLSWLRHNAPLLRELTCTQQCLDSVLPLLRTATHLQQLCASVNLAAFNNAAAVHRTASGLAALSSLVQLSLTLESAGFSGEPGALLAGLRGLRHLTHCSLTIEGSGPGFLHMGKAGLQQLPAGLMSLSLLVRLGLHTHKLEMSLQEMGECELFSMAQDSHEGIDETENFDEPYPSAQQPAMLLASRHSRWAGRQVLGRAMLAGSYSNICRVVVDVV